MDYQWIIDTLGETWDDLDRYVAARPESDYDRPTACPGWAVRDLVGHLLGLTRVVLGEPVPAYPGPWPDYVHNPMGEVNESFVALYRRQPMSEVLVAYRDANRRALDALRDLDESGWERVGWTPVGDGPAHRFQEIRISDAWIHYQDARDALGEP
ncbi:MAG: maleylpyruvate isomerase N-terminal domain-containing protein, partial [Acidimicrobiales bacterium]